MEIVFVTFNLLITYFLWVICVYKSGGLNQLVQPIRTKFCTQILQGPAEVIGYFSLTVIDWLIDYIDFIDLSQLLHRGT